MPRQFGAEERVVFPRDLVATTRYTLSPSCTSRHEGAGAPVLRRSVSAQVRTTLTHVHGHSARVFAYIPTCDSARRRSLAPRKGSSHDNDTTGARAWDNSDPVAR